MSRQKEKKSWGVSNDMSSIIRVYNIFRFPQEPNFSVFRFTTTKTGSIAGYCSALGMGPEKPAKRTQKDKGIP
jgi:hypothetical protein